MRGLRLGLGLKQVSSAPTAQELVVTPYSGTATGSWAVGTTSVTRNSSATGNATLQNMANPAIGTTYTVKFDVANWSGDPFFAKVGNASTGQIASNGSKTFSLTATTTAKLVFLVWSGSLAGEVTITNISIVG